jgi:hypothetical protein
VNYGTVAPAILVIFVIVLSYAMVAPLILPFGAAYFAIGYVVWKNQVRGIADATSMRPAPPTRAYAQLLYVYIPQYESGGRLWPKLFKYMLTGLFIAQLTIVGVLGLKQA